MILIMGSSRDDVLYFDSVIRNRQEGMVLNKYPTVSGTIFNQNVVLVKEVYTSLVSSMLTSYFLATYDVMLVIMVGRCRSFNPSLKTGDIAYSTNIIPLDVDQIAYMSNLKLGQVPGFESNINPSEKVISTLDMTLSKLSLGNHYPCTFLSTDTIFEKREQFERFLGENDRILGIDGNVVFDSESGGAAVACTTYGIPFVAVKVIENSVGKNIDIDDYIAVIKKYSSVGKAIISFVGEIGRSDLIND